MFSTFAFIIIGLLSLSGISESQRRGGPKVITEPERFTGEAGSSITLPCRIRNVGRRSVFWFKGDSPQGRELIMQMKSLKGEFKVPRQYQEIVNQGKLDTDGSNLVIHNLESSDEDAYTCSIAWARQSVTHHLTVVGGAPTTPAPELFVTKVPSDGQVSVSQGAAVALSCMTSGNLPTTVSWYKEGEQETLAVGNVLNLFETTPEDAGRYICTADNGVSEPISEYFDVSVEYITITAPIKDVVASGESLMAQLECHVDASTTPQVVWYNKHGPMQENERHRFEEHGNVHYLILENMIPDDLGEYKCYGYSGSAWDEDTITVTAAPGKVEVLDVTYTGADDRYTIRWQVNSLAPINFYYLGLKEPDTEYVTTSSIEGSSDPADGRMLYRSQTELDFIPGQTYEIMLKAVATPYTPGPDNDHPFTYTPEYRAPVRTHTYDYAQPEAPTSGYDTYDYRQPSQPTPRYDYTHPVESDRTEPEESINSEDAWKWWKVTMTLLSRLPQVARALQ